MTVCLLFQQADECWFCGEWVHIEAHGGFIGPHENRYCSQDCIEEVAEMRAREEQRKSNWCHECGYDNYEHGLYCPTGERHGR